MITVKFDDAEIKKALARMQHTTAHPKAALQDIGEYLLVSTKQRFSAGRAPSGAYWEENRPSTLNRPGNRGGCLA